MLYIRNSFLNYNYPLEKADVCIIGIPFDSTSINPGSRNGPVAIREALKIIEGYDPELGFDVFEKLKICDLGDIDVVPGSYEMTAERIKDTVNFVKETNPDAFLLFIGGEHLISLPIIEELKPDTVLDFDAHADLRKEFLGNEFSHTAWASHIVRKFNLVQKGVRSFCGEELPYIKKIGRNRISGKIYLTVDIDVFSPCIAPETGLPEPDGWNFSEFCRNLKNATNLIGADIVEVSPGGFNSKTAILAANVIKKILGRVAVERL